ncbi:MAG: MBL fold metallo-hydrolase [Dysosmobacter welbionis]
MRHRQLPRLEVNGRRIWWTAVAAGADEVSNDAFPFAANDIDFVLVTHAHIDHTGGSPCW